MWVLNLRDQIGYTTQLFLNWFSAGPTSPWKGNNWHIELDLFIKFGG